MIKTSNNCIFLCWSLYI